MSRLKPGPSDLAVIIIFLLLDFMISGAENVNLILEQLICNYHLWHLKSSSVAPYSVVYAPTFQLEFCDLSI